MVEAGAYDASNFNQLLSYLGSMTPQQRAQVGRMHQNDFEVITALSLINSAEARAKQAMMTQQAMGQPAAPPVNQQVIAETAQNALPEEVGIGALPERSLTGMADGGIVGYADGGGMMMGDGYNMAVGYEPNRTPAMSYAGGGYVERYADEGLVSPLQQIGAQIEQVDQFLQAAQKSGDASSISYYQDAKQKLISQLEQTARELNLTTKPPAEGPRALREEKKKAAAAPAPAPTPAPTPAPAPAAPRPSTGGATATRPAAAAAPAGMVLPRTPEEFARMYEQASGAIKAEDPAETERKNLQADIVEAARARQAEFDKEVAARGDRYKSREERLARREEGLGKDAKTNEGLALLSAAAAVLQPGGLAAGLMKAANVAIPQYQAGLEKLKAAQEKIDEGRDRIDELRQNYDDLTSRERRQLADGIKTAAIEARKLSIDGIMAAQGVKEKKAASIYEAMASQAKQQQADAAAKERTQMEIASRERVAGQEPADVRTLRAMLADPRLLEIQQKLQATKGSGLAALLGKYADPMELEMLKQQDPQLHAMVVSAMQRMMTPAPVTGTPSGPVRQ